MARAKNTDRAVARRRHREQQRALEPTSADVVATGSSGSAAVAEQPRTTLGTAMRGSLRMPDIRADLKILPGMLLHTRKLWIPFVILGVSFVLALLLPTSSEVFVGPGQMGTIVHSTVLPSGIDKMAALFVQLTLPPTSLFVFFIGGFLAPRASYLVGALLGIVDGILWAAYVLVANSSANELTNAAAPKPSQFMDILVLIFFSVFIGVLAAGFAAWYRNFLRQSNERARQNRIAREQAAKAKAKEDERKAREEQRKAAAAAKSAPKATTSAASGQGATGSSPSQGSTK